MLTEMYPHQCAAVDKLLHVKVGALYMDMGTGKTRTALELIHRRMDSHKIHQVLWLCPYSMVPDLPELLAEHVEGFLSYCKIAGIESLSSSQQILQELLTYVSNAPTYLVVDESLLIKNPRAYRTQNIIEISKLCEYKLILNGTPISRNESDLFSQWYVLDWRILGYRSYWSFAANHLEFDPNRPDRIVRTFNVDYLSRKIAPYTYEVKKEDVLDLPPKMSPEPWSFSLTTEQEKHYSEVSEQLMELLDERKPDTIYRLFGATQAITSGFAIQFDDKMHTTRYRMYQPKDNPRLQTLSMLLEHRIKDEQCVIFCRFTQEILDIIELLEGRAIPYYGEMSQAERHQNKAVFQAGQAQFFVANKSCAQFGLNLQFCHNVIFYNNDWDYATRAQAEDRVHRIGQTSPVRIYEIYATDTIDAAVLDCIARKSSLSESFRAAIRRNNDARGVLGSIIRGVGLDG